MIKCLKCNNHTFQVGQRICPSAEIDFKDGNLIINPVNDATEQSIIVCLSCGEKYDLMDEKSLYALVHPPVQCIKCGKTFMPEEVDENGVCAICRAKELDESFAQLEQLDADTLLRMLAQARVENYKLSTSIKDTEKKPKRTRKKKDANESKQEAETVLVDGENENDNDIEISEDVAPELPTEVTDMSAEINAEGE